MVRRYSLVSLLILLGAFAGVFVYVRAQATACRETQFWRCAAAMPTARSEIQAAVLEDKIYVAGGLGMAGKVYDVFEVYTPIGDSWASLAPLPQPLHHVALAAADGRIFLSGGYTDLQMARGIPDLYAYDPDTNTWTKQADMPSPRAAHVMLNVADKLYVIGGIGNDLYSMWRYDPKTDSWETGLSPLPTAREHLAAAVIDEEIYVIGGRLSENTAVLEIYNPQEDSWREAPAMPTARGGLTAAALGGRLHVAGGEAFGPDKTFDEHEVFDPQMGNWQTLEPLPVARHGLTSVAFEDKWYVIGGATKPGAQTLISVTDAVSVFAE